jgi:hypothetical protein
MIGKMSGKSKGNKWSTQKRKKNRTRDEESLDEGQGNGKKNGSRGYAKTINRRSTVHSPMRRIKMKIKGEGSNSHCMQKDESNIRNLFSINMICDNMERIGYQVLDVAEEAIEEEIRKKEKQHQKVQHQLITKQ